MVPSFARRTALSRGPHDAVLAVDARWPSGTSEAPRALGTLGTLLANGPGGSWLAGVALGAVQTHLSSAAAGASEAPGALLAPFAGQTDVPALALVTRSTRQPRRALVTLIPGGTWVPWEALHSELALLAVGARGSRLAPRPFEALGSFGALEASLSLGSDLASLALGADVSLLSVGAQVALAALLALHPAVPLVALDPARPREAEGSLRPDRPFVSLGSYDARVAGVAGEAVGARKAGQARLASGTRGARWTD